MKIMIASDIHGSAYYCDLLLKAFREEQADRLLLLGDILYHGPRNDLPKDYAPKKVIDMLSEAAGRIFCVRGNCDTEVDQMVLPFPVMADYAVLQAGERLAYATHGHLYHPGHLPPLQPGDLLLFGHTHVPEKLDTGECMCLNTGSVSIPKNGSRHSCMVMDGDVFKWLDLVSREVFMSYPSDVDR